MRARAVRLCWMFIVSTPAAGTLVLTSNPRQMSQVLRLAIYLSKS